MTWLYPFDPLSKVEIRVVNQPVMSGQILVEIDYCKERAWVPHDNRWSLTNDITIILPVATASLPVGCHIKRLLMPLPRHVVAGEYRLQLETIYEPWPWRAFVYVRQSPVFAITPRTETP